MQWSFVRLVWLVFHPGIARDPIHFPSFAAIIREGLFEAAGIGSDVGDNESNQNGSPIQRLLVEKLTAPVLELTNRGRAHAASLAVGKIKAPLLGRRIVQTEIKAFEVTCGAVGYE